MDVGADRIARAAHAALRYLEAIRQAVKQPFPIAWGGDSYSHTSAIEVYPAATLKQLDIRSVGYKKKENTEERSEITQSLKTKVTLNVDTQVMMCWMQWSVF